MLISRTRLAAALLAPALVAGAATVPAASAATPARQVGYHHWATSTQLDQGVAHGLSTDHGRLQIDSPSGHRRYHGVAYDSAWWTSPWVSPGFALTELIPSWEASTPAGTWIRVRVRGISEGGTPSSWDDIADWAAGDGTIKRTTYGSQPDDLAHVATDTWIANYGGFRSYQLRVVLYRKSGTTRTPQVQTLGAIASNLPAVDQVRTSRPSVARGIVLDVPTYSQMTHRGQYPQFGGGGEAWCSPTSTTMVLGYYHRLPGPRAYRWVSRSYSDRVVDHSARMTYDYGYGGTGNWPFNTAYAATRTHHAFVTRFKSLVGVEHLIKAGIPVITSITFGRGELHGAPISATNGHLVVVVGFTSTGDVVVNDPAAWSNGSVRRVYDRGEFENAWLKRYPVNGSMRGSGGLAYVVRDAAHPLPPRQRSTAW
ncbi:MAG: peptidase C39 family protein [Nocardioidaceae bacterium]